MRIDSFVLAHRFSKLSMDWLRTKGVASAYIWIRENPHQSDNLHLTIHVPSELSKAYAGMQRKWLKLAGARYRKNGMYSQVVGIRPGDKIRELTPDEYLEHLERWLGYCLKGAHPDVCDELQIAHDPQGGLWGRRVGLSQNISRKAREEDGFKFRRMGAPMFPARARLDRYPDFTQGKAG
jgi:hypothetical protein